MQTATPFNPRNKSVPRSSGSGVRSVQGLGPEFGLEFGFSGFLGLLSGFLGSSNPRNKDPVTFMRILRKLLMFFFADFLPPG